MIVIDDTCLVTFLPDHVSILIFFILGRASSSPTVDLFITLMSLGLNGYKRLLQERKENFNILKDELKKVSEKHGERIMETKGNPISIGKEIS